MSEIQPFPLIVVLGSSLSATYFVWLLYRLFRVWRFGLVTVPANFVKSELKSREFMGGPDGSQRMTETYACVTYQYSYSRKSYTQELTRESNDHMDNWTKEEREQKHGEFRIRKDKPHVVIDSRYFLLRVIALGFLLAFCALFIVGFWNDIIFRR